MPLMSLQLILETIKRRLDFNPELRQYVDGLVIDADTVYQELSDAHGWRFFETEAKIKVYGPVTGVVTTKTVDATDGTNLRRIQRSGTDTTHYFFPYMLGQTFVYGGLDYTIVGLETLTAPTIDGYTVAYLDRELPGTLLNEVDWTIRFDTYALPAECIETLGWSSRDDERGPLLMLDRRHEERQFLDAQDSGTPWVLIETDTLSDVAPTTTPTLTAGTVAGADLATNTMYGYRCCFYAEGRESPPGVEVQVTTGGAANPKVRVSDLPEPRWWDGATWKDSGRLLRIYRRDVTNRGPWYRIAEQSDTTFFEDTSLLPAGQADWVFVPRLFPVSQYRYVRAWYTANATLELTLRYRRRPPPLVANTDVPQWPERYHDVIPKLALKLVLSQHGDRANAAFWGGLAAGKVERMKARYLSNEAVHIRFGRRQQSGRTRRQLHGTPSITG